MRDIRVRMQGMQGIRMGMQAIRVGIEGIRVGIRGIRVGMRVYKHLTGVFQGFSQIRYPLLYFNINEKLISKTHLSSCFQGLQLLLSLSTVNNVSQAFHFSNFNNISRKFFSNFCFNLIILQNFVLRS